MRVWGAVDRRDSLVRAAAQEPGQKNCRFAETDMRRVVESFLAFAESEQSKIFPNKAFGYSKITVERPLR
ncbi:MAG: hypothetical protein WCK70_02200 [Chloroflexales bacterium]|jgi:hypothetical protein